MIQYIIADDHKIFRQGLKMILSDDADLHCNGEAGDGKELIKLLRNRKADVILLDLKMPGMDGMEAIKEIRKINKLVKIIVLTMYDDEHFILHMLEAGANGYLLKNAEAEEIKMAIYSVYQQEHYFNQLINNVMLKNHVQQKRETPPFNHTVKLNDKEKEILVLICQELTAAEIAKRVFLSARTVEGIRSGLLEKIGVKSTAGLVLYAVKSGLIK